MLKLILACLLISSLYTIPLNGIPLGEVSFGGEFSEQRTVANSYGQVEEAKPLQVVSFNDIPETTVAPVIVEESTTVGGYSAEVITQAPLEFVQETTTVFVPPPMLESTTVSYGDYAPTTLVQVLAASVPVIETTTAYFAPETTTVFVPPPILETTTAYASETTTVFVPPPMLESTTVYGEYSTEVIPELTGLGFPGVFVPSMLETTTAAYGYAQETTTVFVPPPILETTTSYYASETTTVFVPPPMLESTTVSYGEYAPTTLVQVLAASVPVIETTTAYAPETTTVFVPPPILETTTSYYASETTTVFVPPPMLESTTISYGEYAPTTLVQVLAASVPVIETTTPYAPETKTVFATPPMLETNYYAVPTTVVPVLAASAKNY
jgi:hypothetical protein